MVVERKAAGSGPHSIPSLRAQAQAAASPTFDEEFSETLLVLDRHLVRSIIRQRALVDGENSFLPHILKHVPGVKIPTIEDTTQGKVRSPFLSLCSLCTAHTCCLA